MDKQEDYTKRMVVIPQDKQTALERARELKYKACDLWATRAKQFEDFKEISDLLHESSMKYEVAIRDHEQALKDEKAKALKVMEGAARTFELTAEQELEYSKADPKTPTSYRHIGEAEANGNCAETLRNAIKAYREGK